MQLFHFPALHDKLVDSMYHGGLLMFQHVIEIPQTQEDHSIWDQQLRVAAYCRTSTNQEKQNSSLENQIAYYTAFIQSNCGATSFLRNSDKIYEKKRNASQAPGRRFWPSAAARTRTRSWRPLWTRWWPPGSLIVRSVGWRWTTRPTPCDCYCSKWGGM